MQRNWYSALSVRVKPCAAARAALVNFPTPGDERVTLMVGNDQEKLEGLASSQ